MVEGRLWAYFTSSIDNRDEKNEIINTIEDGMSSGKFVESNPSIVKLTYVTKPRSSGGVKTPPAAAELGPRDGSTSAGGISPGFYILMSFSFVAVVVGVVATRRCINRGDEEQTHFSDPDDSDMMNPLSPSMECHETQSKACSISMSMDEKSNRTEFKDSSILYDDRRKKTFDFDRVKIDVNLDNDINVEEEVNLEKVNLEEVNLD